MPSGAVLPRYLGYNMTRRSLFERVSTSVEKALMVVVGRRISVVLDYSNYNEESGIAFIQIR